MKLSDPVKQTITRFTARFPLRSTDEGSRIWCHQLCEQLAWSHPGEGWGHKSASPTRPHSSDVIATFPPLRGWDIILDAGSPAARLSLDAESMDLPDQTFEPVVPTNHLGDPEPQPPPTDLEARVRALEADMAVVQSALRDACTALERV